MLIYKIIHRAEWRAAEVAGAYAGSEKDRADGFLHFSTIEQVPRTLKRYYANENDLVLVAIDSASLTAGTLKFEPSTGGELYPHLYASLPVSAVTWVRDLTRGPAGEFVLPT